MSPTPSVARLPARLRRGSVWWSLLGQVAMVGAAALCYFAVRGLTQTDAVTARRHGERLMDVERAVGLDVELGVQGLVTWSDTLVAVANWVYIYGHWPVVVTALGWLFARHRDDYRLLRNALFVSGAIGLVFFALLPVAPPRLGVLDVVDTVTERSSSYRALQPPGLINRYAALPSLHFGWNLLVGIAVWRVSRRMVARVFAIAMPAAMGFAVVATGNHYVLDVVAGGAVALTGLYVAVLMRRRVDAQA